MKSNTQKWAAPAIGAALLYTATSVGLTACGESTAAVEGAQFTPQQLTDSLNMVLKSDRKVYSRDIVTRLVNKEGVIKAHEEWLAEKALLLPAQIFRAGAEEVDLIEDKPINFSYSLQSPWPLNMENAAKKTPAVEEGLKHCVDTGGDNFYGEEEIAGQKYFIAIYPDKAVAEACWTCHNDHPNRKDDYPEFKQGDVMGGVVIRVPVK